jgi:agmatine deiminase
VGWKMPAEWEPHSKTWLAWPTSGYTLGNYETEHQAARQTWAKVANSASEFEPVAVVCNPGDEAIARKHLSSSIELHIAPLNDAWMRDIGPTFVRASDSAEIAAVDWVFNGWGAQDWASWNYDSKIASFVAQQEQKQVIKSSLINEGGGIHVNGIDTVLLTETVQLGDGRNSHLSRSEVEQEIHARLGTSKAVWLKRGLTRDYDEFGTRGHIDIVACFANSNTVLFHKQENREHPDFEISLEVEQSLRLQTNFNLIPVPAPEELRDQWGWVDYSYINHYILNNAVLLCSFNDRNDARAKEIMQEAYPGREIVLIEAIELFARGGGIHCITQQQPA